MTTIDERSRHQLYLSLEAQLGHEEADTMMELLPPVGWADVATKTDLRALEDRMDLRFDKVDQRFEMVDQRFDSFEARMDQRFDSFEARMDQRFDAFEARMDQRFLDVEKRFATKEDLEAGLRSVTRVMVFAMVGTMLTLAGLFLTAMMMNPRV